MKTSLQFFTFLWVGLIPLAYLFFSFRMPMKEDDLLKGRYTIRARSVPNLAVHPEEGGPPIFLINRVTISPFQIIEFNGKGRFTVQSNTYRSDFGLQTIKKTGKYWVVDQKIYLKYKKVHYYKQVPSDKHYRFWHRFRMVHQLPKHKRISELDSLHYRNADTLEMNQDYYLIKY